MENQETQKASNQETLSQGTMFQGTKEYVASEELMASVLNARAADSGDGTVPEDGDGVGGAVNYYYYTTNDGVDTVYLARFTTNKAADLPTPPAGCSAFKSLPATSSNTPPSTSRRRARVFIQAHTRSRSI